MAGSVVSQPKLVESWWPADTSEPLLDSTIASVLRQAAESVPDRTALVVGAADPARRLRRTYAQLAEEAESVARALAGRFDPGERIAVWAPSLVESLVLSFAAPMAGLIVVPVNPALRDAEVSHILGAAGVAGLFLVAEHRGNHLAAILERIHPRLPAVREVVYLGGWSEWREATSDQLPAGPEPDDVAQVVFTSGTTGAPKGAMLTHRAMTNAARLGCTRLGLGGDDVCVNTIPLFHVGGQGVAFGVCEAMATHVLVEQFEPGLVLELVETEGATVLPGVPSMHVALIDHPDFGRRDLSRLRAVTSGGAVVPPDLIRHIERALGVQTAIVFGQTEACGWLSTTHLGDSAEDKAETLGQLLPQIEGRVVDPTTGKVVPVAEVGELQVRGFNVMAGYHELPEATAEAIDPEGWLRTGDLVTMDERGYLRIAGRLKDMIVTGGVNVFPAEIEAAIGAHPTVAQVAVLGLPDRTWGEAVVAVVRLEPGQVVEEADVDAFTRERLARHKVPKRWVFVDELPMNAMGKVQKFLLREQLER